jgi:glutamate formiminotransferase/formiminotetrahydrofolate cyclodeaminase
MREAFRTFDLLGEMVRKGNPNSVTDAAVGVLATRACIRGAYLNVRVNVSGLKDRAFAEKLIAEGREIEANAAAIEDKILSTASAGFLKIT